MRRPHSIAAMVQAPMLRLAATLLIGIVTTLALPRLGLAAGRGPSVEEAEQNNATAEVLRLLHPANINGLDWLAEKWRSSMERTSSGTLKIGLFYKLFYDFERSASRANYPNGQMWRLVEKWLKEKPSSPTAVILQSLLFIAQAQKSELWHSQPTTAPWRGRAIVDFTTAARDTLVEHKEIAKKDPHWYVAMARLQKLEYAPYDEILTTHAEALQAFPDYDPEHFEIFDILTERWPSAHILMDGFANTILAQIKGDNGLVQYARLYDHAAQKKSVEDLEEVGLLKWQVAQQGFEKLVEQFPTQWNLQRYALYACFAHDRNTARRFYPAFADSKLVIHSVWGTPLIFERCQTWAVDNSRSSP